MPGWQTKHEKFFKIDSHFHSVGSLQHALEAVGFDVELQQTLCFRLPFQSKRWLFLETLGQLLFPSSGAVYMITTTKNIEGLTPLLLERHRSQALAQAQL